MKNILFVDDEVNVLNGLRRMLRNRKTEWNMEFVDSGAKALVLLEEKPFDVIVSDMRMPGMSGARLLTNIRGKYPGMTRIALSGYSDTEMVLESIKATHLFIAKPADAQTLSSLIERSLSIQSIISNPQLCDFISGISSLPSVPVIYEKLVRILASKEASVDRVAELISTDIGMSVKLLQIVNSAYFGLAREIVSPAEATAHLGLDVIKSLVLSIKIFEKFEEEIDARSLNDIWVRSQLVGNIAKKIARKEGFSQKEADQLLVAGMLQDLGELVMLQYFPEGVGENVQWNDIDDGDALLLERQAVGVSHDQISVYLLRLWGIPQTVVECVAYHHNSGHFTGYELTLPHILFCANVLAEDIINGTNLSEKLTEQGLVAEERLASWLLL